LARGRCALSAAPSRQGARTRRFAGLTSLRYRRDPSQSPTFVAVVADARRANSPAASRAREDASSASWNEAGHQARTRRSCSKHRLR
jgi:hypothetical protein